MADKIPRATVLKIAVTSDVDPRTVERFLRGEPLRERTAARVKRALVELEIALPTERRASKKAAPRAGEGAP